PRSTRFPYTTLFRSNMLQHVQFHGLSSDRDHFRVKLKMQNSGVVTADLVGSIIIKAYNGDVEVYSQRLNEQLVPGLDLLGLLSRSEEHTSELQSREN